MKYALNLCVFRTNKTGSFEYQKELEYIQIKITQFSSKETEDSATFQHHNCRVKVCWALNDESQDQEKLGKVPSFVCVIKKMCLNGHLW